MSEIATMKQLPDTPYDYSRYIDSTPDLAKWDFKAEQGGIRLLKRLIRTAENYTGEGGVVIGILGDWGTGKTSILKGAEHYFKNRLDYPVLFFEAWKYYAEENPVIPLLQKLIDSAPGEETKKNFKGILETALLAGTDILLGNLSRGALSIAKIEEYWEKRKEIGDIILERISLYDTLTKKISDVITKIKGGQEKRFIIIVDDLDRCLPDTAVKLLEGLRFYFKAANVVIILGLNEEIIAHYLEDVYWLKSNKPLINGSQFLKKIFDWHIECSRATPDMVIDYYFGKEEERIQTIFKTLDSLSYRTWKRISNRYYSFSEDIARNCAAFEAIVVECFPEMDIYLRNHPEVKGFLSKNLKLIKSPDKQLRKNAPAEILDFLKKTGENIWNDIQEGKAVIKRLRKAIW